MALNIRTQYFVAATKVKLTCAEHANSAVLRAVNNMQMNTYGADSAEIYDKESGALHAQIARSKTGAILITYYRDATAFKNVLPK